MKFGCIYCITNKINGKNYIGQTINMRARTNAHKRGASNSYIDRSIKKHGKENFSFSIIENFVPECDLNKKERFYINKFNTLNPNGYNLTPGGESLRGKDNPMYGKRGINSPIYGIKRSEAMKRKISEANKRRGAWTEETRKRASESHKGYKWSQESKNKLSKSISGEKHPLYGKKVSQKTKDKISKSLKGRKLSKEIIYNISIKNKGKKRTPEQKKHYSNAQNAKGFQEKKLKNRIIKHPNKMPYVVKNKRGKWAVQRTINGVCKYFGSYNTLEDANKKSIEIFKLKELML